MNAPSGKLGKKDFIMLFNFITFAKGICCLLISRTVVEASSNPIATYANVAPVFSQDRPFFPHFPVIGKVFFSRCKRSPSPPWPFGPACPPGPWACRGTCSTGTASTWRGRSCESNKSRFGSKTPPLEISNLMLQFSSKTFETGVPSRCTKEDTEVRERLLYMFLPSAKPSGPRTVRVLLLVGGEGKSSLPPLIIYQTLAPFSRFMVWSHNLFCMFQIEILALEQSLLLSPCKTCTVSFVNRRSSAPTSPAWFVKLPTRPMSCWRHSSWGWTRGICPCKIVGRTF